jgi:hypothetical protein
MADVSRTKPRLVARMSRLGEPTVRYIRDGDKLVSLGGADKPAAERRLRDYVHLKAAVSSSYGR